MFLSLNDTITAPATPPGTGAISVIRVSGHDAIFKVSKVFSRPEKLLAAEGYQALHGFIMDDGAPLDEVVCLVFRAPHSYTGEDMVEVSGHGNPDLSTKILQMLLTECRLAEPGEFTFRAFMNHKLDLAQAEAVSDLINAQTAKAEKVALNQLKGLVSNQIKHFINALTDCRIKFELSIDFADQDLPEMDLSIVQAELETIMEELLAVYNTGKQGKILRDGYTVCLAGAPNVGKSSLFNRFLNENRAIVTSTPGTTRDYLEEWINLDGFPIRLVDTAGLRETRDQVERIGISKTREIITQADLVIYITDPETVVSGENSLLPDSNQCTLRVMNKIDLLGFSELPSDENWQTSSIVPVQACIPCSTLLPQGLDAIRREIINKIALPENVLVSALVTNSRHLQSIDRAIKAIRAALDGIGASSGYEFIAFDLIEAVSALSEITGAVTTDEMLERIFSGFCIGK